MPQHSTWAEWEVEKLKAAAALGLSAGQLVRDLVGKTRNAVIGKAHRIGVRFGMGGPNPGAEANRVRAAAKRASPKPRTTPFRLPPAPTFRERVEKLAADAALTSVRLMVTELTFKEGRPVECRYILEGRGHEAVYCGSPIEPGQSYCLPHCRVCFNFRR